MEPPATALKIVPNRRITRLTPIPATLPEKMLTRTPAMITKPTVTMVMTTMAINANPARSVPNTGFPRRRTPSATRTVSASCNRDRE